MSNEGQSELTFDDSLLMEELYQRGLSIFERKYGEGMLINLRFERSLVSEEKEMFHYLTGHRKGLGLRLELENLWTANYTIAKIEKKKDVIRTQFELKKSVYNKGSWSEEEKKFFDDCEKEFFRLFRLSNTERREKEEIKKKLQAQGEHYKPFWRKYSNKFIKVMASHMKKKLKEENKSDKPVWFKYFKKFIGMTDKHREKNLNSSAEKSFFEREKVEELLPIGTVAVAQFVKDFSYVQRDVENDLKDHESFEEKMWKLVERTVPVFVGTFLGVILGSGLKTLWQWIARLFQ